MIHDVDKFAKLLGSYFDTTVELPDGLIQRVNAVRDACLEASAQGFGGYAWELDLPLPQPTGNQLEPRVATTWGVVAGAPLTPIAVTWAVAPGATQVIFTATYIQP